MLVRSICNKRTGTARKATQSSYRRNYNRWIDTAAKRGGEGQGKIGRAHV